MKKRLSLVAAASILALLSACGSSDNSDSGSGSGSQASSDPFVSSVLALIGRNSDSTEPESIASFNVTAQDSADTVPIR